MPVEDIVGVVFRDVNRYSVGKCVVRDAVTIFRDTYLSRVNSAAIGTFAPVEIIAQPKPW